MKKFIAFLSCLGLLACSNQVTQSGSDKQVLFTVADEAVSKQEFKYIYEKNNSDDENLYSRKSLEEYLDLYQEFKLKVKAAKDAGLDTTEKYLNEYKSYRNQLAEPYLKDQDQMDSLVKEAYNRKQHELKVRHILFRLPKDATPKDTLDVYQEAKQVRNDIINGNESFEAMVMQHSDDPAARKNKGKLGYFSVFKMVYPFESASYQLEEGAISEPVRTKYGYHLIKLEDKRPYSGKVTAAHIMLKNPKNKGPKVQKRKKQKIDSIHRAITDGAAFEKMVRKHSQDRRSKRNQGKLPAFERTVEYLPENFIDTAFALEENGAISQPFKTKYGWHIVKRIDKEGIKPFEEMKKSLEKEVKKNNRSSLIEKSVAEDVKEREDFKFYNENFNMFIKQMDTMLLQGKWELKQPNKYKKPLIKIEDELISLLSFAEYVKQQQEKANYPTVYAAVQNYYEDFETKQLIDYLDRNLEEKYPEFRHLLREYQEGILLFEITDRRVWSKAMEDTTGLKKYFENNKEKYQEQHRFGKRKHAFIFEVADEKAAKAVKGSLEDGTSPQQVAKKHADQLNDSLKSDKYEDGDHQIVDQIPAKKGVYNLTQDGQQFVVYIKAVEPPQPKGLEEIRGVVIADYQDYLEEQWINQLKEKYPVKVNEEVLDSMVQ